MSTPHQIIEEHRQKLIHRLLAGHRLLGFRPNGKRRLDIYKFFEQNSLINIGNDSIDNHRIENQTYSPEELLKAIIEKGEARIRTPSIKQYIKPLKSIQLEAEDYSRSTGNWPLCLGYPFIYVPSNIGGGGSKGRFIPLLLWKIKIKIEQGNTIVISSHRPEFNFIFEPWLEIYHNIKMPWDNNGEEIEDISTVIEQIREYLQGWQQCESTEIQPNNPIEKYDGQGADRPCVIPNAVIGNVNFKYQSLLKDLGKLKEKARQGGSLGLLDRVVSANEDQRENNTPPILTQEIDKWLLTDSDAAQEKAIQAAKNEKVMMIKGPPGTGKSQTIVNLIANFSQQEKRVALVCHKKPALDVIYKRLSGAEVGLERIVTQINSSIDERSAVIQRIRDFQDESPPRINPEIQERREDFSDEIENKEKTCIKAYKEIGEKEYSIRGHCRAIIDSTTEFFDAFSDHRFNEKTEIYKTLDEIAGDSKPKRRFLLSIRHKALDKIRGDSKQEKDILDEIKTLSERFLECDYMNNPWQKIDNDFTDLPKLRSDIAWMENLYNEIKNEISLAPRLSLYVNLAHRFLHSLSSKKKLEIEQLIKLTQHVFKYTGIPVKPLWKNLYCESENPYTKYKGSMNTIEAVQFINKKIEESKTAKIFHEEFNNESAKWHDILRAMICKVKYDKLSKINYVEYEKALKRLKDAIEEKRKADSKQILSKFSHQDICSENLGNRDLLRLRGYREHRKSTLRDIYTQGRDKIWNIFPILLTNPNTVSEILPLEVESLDLVIVDEASQMFVADAMPLFYRAKQIIIVGDEMQMPPSDFFSAGFSDDDTGDEISLTGEEDTIEKPKGSAPAAGRFELIEATEHLLSGKTKYLLEVHYRSRSSELIAFSNHAFYEGKLHAAKDNQPPLEYLTCPIEMEHRAGEFNRGINQAEIDAVIEKLNELWQLEHPPSIGVIVFNVKQADELLRQINENEEPTFRTAYEEARQRTDDGEDAGFFVRSVEDVQGDERDIIIMATTYAGDTKNFGPIAHKEKGRKRLNVAITRAKLGMIIITSLNIDNIANETTETDRKFFWQYMRYARAISENNKESAVKVLRELNPEYKQISTGRGPDSEFEIQVANYLRANGYYVEYQIGESGFRIDLGVKLRKDDERYLCGVECDGRIWHSDWKARHNDIWRQKILEGKGWKIIRIWSDRWFNFPDMRQEFLLGKLEKIIAHEQLINGAP